MSLAPWRSLVGRWPIPLRQRYADLTAANESSGLAWPASEHDAFRQVWRETTPADRVIPPVLDRSGKPIPPAPDPTWADLADVFDIDCFPAWLAWRAENPTGCRPDRERKMA
jgi:hypothetical protein